MGTNDCAGTTRRTGAPDLSPSNGSAVGTAGKKTYGGGGLGWGGPGGERIVKGREFLKFTRWLGSGGGGWIGALSRGRGIGEAERWRWDVSAVGKETNGARTGRAQRAGDRVEEAERREHKYHISESGHLHPFLLHHGRKEAQTSRYSHPHRVCLLPCSPQPR